MREAIEQLRDRYAAALAELHDDYIHSRALWRDLRVRVRRYNERIEIPNPVTKSHVNGEQLAAKFDVSVQRLGERTLKDLIAQFELFLADVIRLWLTTHTQLIAAKALNVATLLACTTLDEAKSAAVRDAVESTIADKTYGKPQKWFSYLRQILGFQFDSVSQSTFIEMKARRDVLEHAGGIVEAQYLEKAGAGAKYKSGQRVEVTDADVRASYDLVLTLIVKLSAAVMLAVPAEA